MVSGTVEGFEQQVSSPRHRYAVGDLSLVEPGADFIAPPREDRSAAAVAEDLASQAGTAPIRSSIVRKLLELYKHPNLDFVNYVCDGLRSGFDIGVKENIEGFELDNSKTAKEWMDGERRTGWERREMKTTRNSFQLWLW